MKSFTEAFFAAKEVVVKTVPSDWIRRRGEVFALCRCRYPRIPAVGEIVCEPNPIEKISIRNRWKRYGILIREQEFGVDYWDHDPFKDRPPIISTWFCEFLWEVCPHCGTLFIMEPDV